jgi:hypothetical protein
MHPITADQADIITLALSYEWIGALSSNLAAYVATAVYPG